MGFGTMNPLTLIQSPLAKAISASEMTNDGKMDVRSTTRLSAASRSRKTQRTQVKKAWAVGWKLESQYEMAEKTRAKTTDERFRVSGNVPREGESRRHTQVRDADEEVGDDQSSRVVETVALLLDIQQVVLEIRRTVRDRHERHEGRAVKDGVDEGNDGLLRRIEPQPDRAHHDGEPYLGSVRLPSINIQGQCLPVYIASLIPYTTTSR
jgi:hypothetical protein